VAIVILGVVADDITGAGDIGGMTAKTGYLTVVHTFTPPAAPAFGTDKVTGEVCVLDTDSRFDTPEVAYEKVFAATKALQEAGCQQFFNKTCSVFRGNIGAEFDAMLDALNEEFAVVILGFPKNGRLTKGGVHYIHGKRLEDSDFRYDPVHPTTRSSLVEILQAQTRRKVAHLGAEVVAGGELHQAIKAARGYANYLILDVADQAALALIARAVQGCRVLCGSSALAEELPALWPPPKPAPEAPLPPVNGTGVLCLAGSLTPQTRAQLGQLKAKGMESFTLDTRCLFHDGERSAEVARLAEGASAYLERGDEVLVHTENDPEVVRATQWEGEGHGLSKARVGQLISRSLAAVAVLCLERTGLNRLVVAGGDTSATVCRALGISRMQVWREIQPGLPSMLALPDSSNEVPMLLVLKSGSFGEPEFLEEAVQHLKEVTHECS